jgi:hypothetical protein
MAMRHSHPAAGEAEEPGEDEGGRGWNRHDVTYVILYLSASLVESDMKGSKYWYFKLLFLRSN